MSNIHPSAYVDPKAEIGRDVTIGPFCHVDANVTLGDRCVLHGHCTLLGQSEFGPDNAFFPNCVLGAAPQDLKYKGGATYLRVGAANSFREHVTVHRGTESDHGVTTIGNRNLFMVGVHVAHDAIICDHVILANYVQVAGHALIEDCVNVGGGAAMHHFVTIGRYAYVGGMTAMRSDVAPYMKTSGYDAKVRGFNSEGLRRWNISEESIAALKEVYRTVFCRRDEQAPGRTRAALREIEGNGLLRDEHVRYLVDFLTRQMDHSVHGRHRESCRTGKLGDREMFYSAAPKEPRA